MNDKEEDYICGRNAILAYLEANSKQTTSGSESEQTGGELDKIFLTQSARPDKRIELIKTLAREQKVPIIVSNNQQLERLVGSESRHQGIVARLSHGKSLTLSEFLQSLNKKASATDEKKLLVIVDGIQDPHNLGAIIRVAHAAGAKGLITTFRRAVGTTAAVARASAGALARLPVVKVQNLVSAIEELKKHGFWIAGLDAAGTTSLFKQDLNLNLAVVIGGEGTGLGRLVTQHCDFLLNIPMSPDCESLNAAVAAGIVFYEYVRQNSAKIGSASH
jgi:23S rRNA (guanosine2251-2'-O)-methyltransferase